MRTNSAIEADYGLESHNKAAVVNQLGLYIQNGMQPPRFFRFHTYADDYSGTISSVDSAVRQQSNNAQTDTTKTASVSLDPQSDQLVNVPFDPQTQNSLQSDSFHPNIAHQSDQVVSEPIDPKTQTWVQFNTVRPDMVCQPQRFVPDPIASETQNGVESYSFCPDMVHQSEQVVSDPIDPESHYEVQSNTVRPDMVYQRRHFEHLDPDTQHGVQSNTVKPDVVYRPHQFVAEPIAAETTQNGPT